MILEILWCPIFTLLEFLMGGVKMESVPFLPQVCPVFTLNCGVKTGHLKVLFFKSKSHSPKPCSVP